jgi:hypothetical protein
MGVPFTRIEDKQALLALYEAVPELLKDYPDVVDRFFSAVDSAMDVAEQYIEEAWQKTAPGEPGQIIHFCKNTGGDRAKSQQRIP